MRAEPELAREALRSFNTPRHNYKLSYKLVKIPFSFLHSIHESFTCLFLWASLMELKLAISHKYIVMFHYWASSSLKLFDMVTLYVFLFFFKILI
jgi:hypothetical protein